MAGRCDQCGTPETMPYTCKFCSGRYCAAHRLPENHACQGLGAYRERVREEGRIFASEPGAPLQAEVSRRASLGAKMDELWKKADGKMTFVFLGIMVGVYILQWIVALTGNAGLYRALFPIERDFILQPWTIITSVFSHSLVDFNHLLFNGIVLYFFGTNVERLIGTKRFTWLFLGSGALAGIIQVTFFGGSAVGASGAIQGIMGLLVVLAPRLTVLVFFVIPAPLWALTIFVVLIDLFGLIGPGDGIAHLAHLAGLAVGAAYGYHLKSKGLRAVYQRPPPTMRRYF